LKEVERVEGIASTGVLGGSFHTTLSSSFKWSPKSLTVGGGSGGNGGGSG